MSHYSIIYKCDHCGHREHTLIGSGWAGPFNSDVVKNVLDGKYGQRWSDLLRNNPGAKVDELMDIYVCPACHRFKNESNLSIYLPKKPEEIPPEINMPFLQLIKIRKYRKHLLLRGLRYYMEFRQRPYYHRCDECGKRMHALKDGELFRCPSCFEGWMHEEERNII